jgi:hypothetical protein
VSWVTYPLAIAMMSVISYFYSPESHEAMNIVALLLALMYITLTLNSTSAGRLSKLAFYLFIMVCSMSYLSNYSQPMLLLQSFKNMIERSLTPIISNSSLLDSFAM